MSTAVSSLDDLAEQRAPSSKALSGAAIARAATALLQPIDGAWLAAYRVLFGLAMAVSMERFLAYGWVEQLLVAPRFRFHYWGFAWVAPLPLASMRLLFWVLVALALAVSAGLAFRVTAPLLAAGLTYIQLIDVSTYLNHYYLAGLVAWLFAVSPANRTWSLDAWIRGRFSEKAHDGRIARAWLVLFRTQIGLVYVFAGLAKAGSDWLVHGQPLGIWLGASTDVPILGRAFTLPGVPLAMSWCGFLFDTTIVLWLSWRRTRPWAYVVVVVFHALTRILFDIGMFPIIMTLSALVFFSPSWPRRFFSPKARRDDEERARAPRPSIVQRVALGLGALYCLAQIAMPLRCHLYGGDVLWHEQGMRFSWRVMIRAKGGATTFVVRVKDTGKIFHVSPRAYLNPFQENEMAGQADLVLQLAHHIRDDFARRGYGDVEVRVESNVSLNGRRGAPMIDPEVDLTTVHDGIGRASWILPAPADPPPPTRPVR
ncbi:MAG: HTTM domain-containing protein [Labilithrix sp.]|nr:HTTM domain-containing protein [Labilithrix sp.]